MWCLLGSGVVPTSGIKYACRHPYISKRTDPNSARHSYMRRAWSSHKVQIMPNNAATVAAINNQTSRAKESGHLLWRLAFLTTHHQCYLHATYILGKHNTLADTLLRNNPKLFRLLHPQTQQNLTPIPSELLRMVIIEQLDWTSLHWTELWTYTLTQD